MSDEPMGGTLTLFTAASHANVIKGAIPINAVVHIGNPDMAGLAFGLGLPDTVPDIGSNINDHVVNPGNGPRIVSGVGSSRAELLWLENSYHVATIDHDKALIAQLTINFIKSIAGR